MNLNNAGGISSKEELTPTSSDKLSSHQTMLYHGGGGGIQKVSGGSYGGTGCGGTLGLNITNISSSMTTPFSNKSNSNIYSLCNSFSNGGLPDKK